MKFFLSVFIFILSFQSLTIANDISDFEIDGMSIGDSALDYFTKKELDNKDRTDFYKDNDFMDVTINPKDSQYDSIGLTLKPNDKNYIIYAINGGLHFDNNDECLVTKEKIVKSVSDMFKDAEVSNPGKRNYAADPTGESKSYSIYYWIKGAFIEISCYDITEKLANEKNWIKNILNVSTVSKEFADFLLTKQYGA